MSAGPHCIDGHTIVILRHWILVLGWMYWDEIPRESYILR